MFQQNMAQPECFFTWYSCSIYYYKLFC